MSSTDHVKQKLEILQTIEQLGGSAGYSKNPEAFEHIITALDTYDASALDEAIKKLSSNTNPAAQKLKSNLQAQVDLQRTDPKLAQKTRVLEVLQGVEKLGGYAGYKRYITETPPHKMGAVTSPAAIPSDYDEWSHSYASVWIASAFVYTVVIFYVDNYTVDGGSWEVGVGFENLDGTLTHAKWSTLCSAENDLYVQSNSAGVVTIHFVIDHGSSYVAQLVLANPNVQLTTMSYGPGRIRWSLVPDV